jgi:hypothetical protein
VLQALGPLWVGQGGTGLICAAGLGAIVIWRTAQPGRERSLAAVPALLLLVMLIVLTQLILTTWYLFTPGFLDHIEASVASSVHYFRAGLPLYPPTDSYTFHGLLYGPLLAELNSLGYLLGGGVFGAKIVGWLAGWAAIVLILRTRAREIGGWAGYLGIAYALCVLASFGEELTTDRAEPLLLLCATAALLAGRSFPDVAGLLVVSALAGLAFALKLHGPVYCLPALYLWWAAHPRDHLHRGYIILAIASVAVATVAAALPFLPENVSLTGYVHYLTLALKHGMDRRLLLLNIALLLGLWAPLLVLTGVAGLTRLPRGSKQFAALLLGAQSLVALIAAKPGAGVHHFLPFLAAHAYLFQRLYTDLRATQPGAEVVAFRAMAALAATILGMTVPTLHSAGQLLAFNLRAPEQARERDELLALSARYPGGMLGVAGYDSYRLANLRPWLTLQGFPQTDYGAFMDLKLSGLDDAPLQRAFLRCDIPFVYMPKPGEPFTLPSNYNGLLFSNAVRNQFAQSYALLERGNYFNVFACRKRS